MSTPATFTLPPELIDQIAERAIELLAERNPVADPEPFLTVEGAAEFLACSTSRIYSLVSARRIPFHKDGSRLLFDRAELRTYIEKGGAISP